MFPGTGQALTGSGPANSGQSPTGSAFPSGEGEAGKPGAGKPGAAARPTTGVPPWEITDSFFAVPPAEASGPPSAGTRPTAAGAAADPVIGSVTGSVPGSAPAPRPSAGTGGPADSTESFPAVGSGADQRSFPRSNAGDSTESLPMRRPRINMEDAFRLFPPVRGDVQPPADDGQD